MLAKEKTPGSPIRNDTSFVGILIKVNVTELLTPQSGAPPQNISENFNNPIREMSCGLSSRSMCARTGTGQRMKKCIAAKPFMGTETVLCWKVTIVALKCAE